MNQTPTPQKVMIATATLARDNEQVVLEMNDETKFLVTETRFRDGQLSGEMQVYEGFDRTQAKLTFLAQLGWWTLKGFDLFYEDSDQLFKAPAN